MRDTENNAKTEPKKEKIRKEIDKVKENIAKQREKYLKVVSLHKELEVKYPKGEIDLKEGVVIFDDGQ